MTISFKQYFAAAAMITAVLCLSACDTAPIVKEDAIPSTKTDITVAEAAKTLGITTETFEAFLDNIGISFDEYISTLDKTGTNLESIREDVEESYNCTYEEYVNTILTVNTKTTPDANEYALFKSELSSFDAYIPLSELNDDKTELTNYDVSIGVADEEDDAYAFDAIIACSGDFGTYMTVLNQYYDCESVEFTNITLFGGLGVTKPDGDNACMDYIFAYDEDTNEILEIITVPVMTLHMKNEADDITLALSNDLGLIFKATGTDGFEKILKLDNLKFQVRNIISDVSETDESDEA